MTSKPSSRPLLERAAPPDAFSSLWATLRVEAATLRQAPGQTIRPPEPPVVDAEEETLEVVVGDKHPDRTGAELEMVRTIGEGGMGVVHLARQVSLRREVAVKTLRPGPGRAKLGSALLQEALVLGNLEHPNIVPVHLVGREADGSPVIVMKHVEGVEWAEYLDHRRELPDGADPLEWHLDVLMQVSRAVSFAHARGIVHRDVKPENVMIGGFGEVYLLDWGLAVSVRDSDRGIFPLASEVRGIAGTPAYMAPEMTLGTGEWLGPATDVYLLGAMLHEVVTGRPRHEGTSIREVLASAHHSVPVDYGEAVPRELAEVCNRATAREPSERFGSAEDFRAALASTLRHRASVALSDEARLRLGQLRAAVEAESGPAADRRVRDLFGECRFGFQQALKAWSENEGAAAGLDEALAAMAHHEIGERNVSAARALVDELGERAGELPALLARLEAELRDEQAEVDRLRERARQTDRGLKSRARAVAALAFGVGAGGSLVVIDALQDVPWARMTHAQYALGWGVVLLACTAIIVHRFRGALWSNEVNRQIVFATVVGLLSVLGFRLVVWASGAPLDLAFRIELILYGMALGTFAALTDPRVLATVPICVAGALLDATITGDGLLTIAASVFLAFAALSWVWRRPRDGGTPLERPGKRRGRTLDRRGLGP